MVDDTLVLYVATFYSCRSESHVTVGPFETELKAWLWLEKQDGIDDEWVDAMNNPALAREDMLVR